jgi:predicted 3-demethylubiquinone-9 3-methyltransferase (glyoxalase superfamily)
MPVEMKPFLMFEGQAEEAINYYMSIFKDGEIHEIVRYPAEGPGPEGTIIRAEFTVAGQRVLCTDSFVKHKFTFTPAFSFFVDCDSEEEIHRLYTALGKGGMALMPLDNYGFSRRFGWVNDRFGVSWQINLF